MQQANLNLLNKVHCKIIPWALCLYVAGLSCTASENVSQGSSESSVPTAQSMAEGDAVAQVEPVYVDRPLGIDALRQRSQAQFFSAAANDPSLAYPPVGHGCYLSLRVCEKYPLSASGVPIRDHDEAAHVDPLRCANRAKEYADWCENSPGVSTLTDFVSDAGRYTTSHTVPGCVLQLDHCPADPARHGQFLRYRDADATSNIDACIARAPAIDEQCGMLAGDPIHATNYASPDGSQVTSRSYFAGAGCVISGACRNQQQSAMSFVDTEPTAQADAARCMERAREQAIACENTAGDACHARFIRDHLSLSSTMYLAAGCKITLEHCEFDPTLGSSQGAVFVETSSDAHRKQGVCTALPRAYNLYCGNPLGSEAKAEFFHDGVAMAETRHAYRTCRPWMANCSPQQDTQGWGELPAMNPVDYRLANPDLVNLTDEELKLHFLRFGLDERRVSSVAFDAQHYAEVNEDLRVLFRDEDGGYDAWQAIDHWLRHGIAEARESSPVFSVLFYTSSYQEITDRFGTDRLAATNHWIQVGMDKGRAGTYPFYAKVYLDRYPDIREAFGRGMFRLATIHYLVAGRYEGRSGRPF